jgi:putative glutamine amidotransferase
MAKPFIGVCVDHVTDLPAPGRDRSYMKLYPPYCNAIVAAGGTPLILPMLPDVNDLRPLLEIVGGVVLVGADDYPPQWYGKTPLPTDVPLTPERENFDREFIRLLIDETELPVFGICGGMQLMAIHAGGSMIQHLPDDGEIKHGSPAEGTRYHDIDIEPGSILNAAVGSPRARVNSMHHQAVERLGEGQIATAWAADGVMEAMEYTGHSFRIGVQWHPERMLDDAPTQALFRAFIKAAN